MYVSEQEAKSFYLNISVSWFFTLRHLQREIENQKAQESRFQQHLKKLDEDIKQNEALLRRTHMEQKTAKVKLLTNQHSSPSNPGMFYLIFQKHM